MPRVTIDPTTLTNGYPSLPVAANSLDVDFQAADSVNFNQATYGNASALLVLFWNTHAADAATVTIQSAPDQLNREGDIAAYSIAAGEIAAFYAPRNGWRQTDGYLYFDPSAATVEIAVIQL